MVLVSSNALRASGRMMTISVSLAKDTALKVRTEYGSLNKTTQLLAYSSSLKFI